MDPYAIRRTGRHPSNRYILSTSPGTRCIDDVPRLLFDKLLVFLRGRLRSQRGAYTNLLPLEDCQFEELCTDVYRELIRRERVVLCGWGDKLSFCPFEEDRKSVV